MFTLAKARAEIGNPARFARGSADVQENRVSSVTVEEQDGLLVYRGLVRGAAQQNHVSFAYHAEEDVFSQMSCACAEGISSGGRCRHVAALMIAVCGGAGTPKGPQEAGDFIEALLDENRGRPLGRRISLKEEAPVQLYPALQTEGHDKVLLSLKIGRTRTYVVRSMAEFAVRAARREAVVYGRELTFSHSESELAAHDVPLFGQIVMLCGNSERVRGAEVMLDGAALDQTMRMLIGRDVEIRRESGETACVKVVRGSIELPIELEQMGSRAQLRVFADHLILGAAGAYRFGEQEILCAYGEDFERASALLRVAAQYPEGIRFDEKQLDAICSQMIAPAMAGVVVRKGQQILAQRMPTPAVPKLYVEESDDGRIVCHARFDYCGTELDVGQEWPHIRHDAALEEDVCAAVEQLFPECLGPGEYVFDGNDDARFALLSEQLLTLERVGEVMVDERLAKKNVKKRSTVSFGLSQEGEKLLLKAEIGDYTQEDLNAALTAYRQKKKYVRLDSGVFLSGEALEQAADTAQVLESMDVTAEEAKAGTQVPMSRTLYLDEAVKARESIRLKAPDAVADWVERLKKAQQTKVEQPATLQAQLRSYQLTGLSWLGALSDAGFNGILADDMGLGKTIQVLSLLLREKEAGRPVRALVVCPASLQLNWKAEAAKFAPSLRCQALIGAARDRAEVIGAEEDPELMITSYDQLRRDVQFYQGEKFTHILLDEAQNIKNAASLAAKAVKTIDAEHRFAMTGTPIENRLSELWSIFDFLMPGYLLTYKKFKDKFEAPIVREANEKARENLHMMVAPFILRRMKKDVLTDLPEKVEMVMTSEMTAEQRKVYSANLAQLLGQTGGILSGQNKMIVLAGLTRLRQICCDPRLCLLNYQGGSGKLDQLREVVAEALAGGHRILLFSQFTTMLELIAQVLEGDGVSIFRLTGETDKEERMRLVEQFNAGGAQVFLISLKAGGTGLNLTGADVVIHYDPWWNVSAQNQATDRAYRIGQTKGVQVIKLIAADSVEERILKLQEQKQILGDGVLLGDEDLFSLDTQALQDILR